MQTTRPPSLLTLLAVTAGLAGCAIAPSDDDVDETTSELTNGTPSGPAYVVELEGIPYGPCTATVISQHYLLSSAHCFTLSGATETSVLTGDNFTGRVYQDLADVVIHPSWDGGAPDREMWDLALIHLRGAGMGAGFSRVPIYAGPETPWTTKGPLFNVSGYGYGSDAPGGTRDCPAKGDNDGTIDQKRSARFAFNGEGMQDDRGTWQSVHGSSSIRTLCDGDSGAGYRLTRNNIDFLFAVQSQSNLIANGVINAPLVAPKMEWIQEQSSDTLRFPLVCSLVHDHRNPQQEVDSYDCVEKPRLVVTRPPLPPPVFQF